MQLSVFLLMGNIFVLCQWVYCKLFEKDCHVEYTRTCIVIVRVLFFNKNNRHFLVVLSIVCCRFWRWNIADAMRMPYGMEDYPFSIYGKESSLVLDFCVQHIIKRYASSVWLKRCKASKPSEEFTKIYFVNIFFPELVCKNNPGITGIKKDTTSCRKYRSVE